MRKLVAMMQNLRIRTSLMLVLGLFFIMLVAGAVLGVGSIYLNNQTLGDVVRTQRARGSLVEAVSSYKETQVILGRALASYAVNSDQQNNAIAADWANVDADDASALSDQTISLLGQAREQYDQTFDEYQLFVEQSKNIPDPAGFYSRVDAAFNDLMKEGVDPMINMLEQGEMNDYQDHMEGTTLFLEDDLLSTVSQLTANQNREIDARHSNEVEHYRLVLLIVVSAIIAALIISVLAYLFLGTVVLRPLRRAGEHFDRIASGDLSQRVDVTNNNEIGQLYAALQRMQQGLTQVVSEVRSGVDEITTGATEIYRGNTDLSSRTEQQAASLQQTAASMEELDSTVRQNTENAMQADQLAKGASDVARRGGDAVNAVTETMQGISSSSGQMSEIVSVIDGIAFQTNILALNAAVEAARAGEQGRGFAVVAGEVRSLAQRSAKAAGEIKQLIDDSVVRIEQGAGRASEAGNIMQEVLESIGQVTTIMTEIAAASREQADGIGQVNVAVTEMDGVVQQNASLVEEAAAAAGSLQTQATRLTQAVAFFRLGGSEVIDVDASEQARLATSADPVSHSDQREAGPLADQFNPSGA